MNRQDDSMNAQNSLLTTEHLTMHFGGLAALEDVNFAVQRGTIHAIIGPNGAGKSTFFNCVTGVLRPTGGRILLEGEDITGLPPEVISQRAIARSYQITNIFPGSTCLENIRIAAQSRRRTWSFLRHHRSDAALLDKALDIVKAVGLHGKEDELAANLSHGEQRNLEIGIALATEPKLLCLDEPTAGMSASETHGIMDLIRKIGESLTILIVEHDMQVVMSLADRITVFNYGQILAEGTPEEIQANPQVQEAYLKM
jgi:branched-chain amino acid transport system ATP-binding protein